MFEIAKTNNVMMSSVLSNVSGWPGGNSSKQVRLIPMHASRHDSVSLAQPTQSSLWFVDTFDKSQTSIQHNYQCDFMNIKENILFLRNEWTTTGEVDKTDRTELGKCIHLYNETQGNISAFDRKLSSPGTRKIDNDKRRRKQRRRQTRRSCCKNKIKMLRLDTHF